MCRNRTGRGLREQLFALARRSRSFFATLKSIESTCIHCQSSAPHVDVVRSLGDPIDTFEEGIASIIPSSREVRVGIVFGPSHARRLVWSKALVCCEGAVSLIGLVHTPHRPARIFTSGERSQADFLDMSRGRMGKGQGQCRGGLGCARDPHASVARTEDGRGCVMSWIRRT